MAKGVTVSRATGKSLLLLLNSLVTVWQQWLLEHPSIRIIRRADSFHKAEPPPTQPPRSCSPPTPSAQPPPLSTRLPQPHSPASMHPYAVPG